MKKLSKADSYWKKTTITLKDRRKMTACIRRLEIEVFMDWKKKHLTNRK